MALAAAAMQPNKNIFQRTGERMEKAREEREEKELKKTEISNAKITLERIGMARDNVPTISEIEQALEKADTETRAEVHRGFVVKMLEDAFEDFPQDFSVDECKPLPKGTGIPKGFMGLEREGRRGETRVYADTFEKDGKKYVNMRIDPNSHWDPRVNPCAVVVCELDKNGKPILEKGAIKLCTEQELNHAAETKHKRPPKETFKVPGLKFRIIPAIWPGFYEVKKSKDRLERETRVAALGELIRGELTPAEYAKITNSKAEAQERDANAKGRSNERETQRRLDELVNKREFAQVALRSTEQRANVDEQQVVDSTEAARKEAEEKARINKQAFGNFVKRWSNRTDLVSEDLTKQMADEFGLDIEEAKKIRGSIEKELGLEDTRSIQQLLKELSFGSEEENKQFREFNLDHVKQLLEKSKEEDSDIPTTVDRYFSALNTILMEQNPNVDPYLLSSRLYLMREQLIQDLKLEGKTNEELAKLAEDLENHTPVIEELEEVAEDSAEKIEVEELDTEIVRDRLNNQVYDLLTQLSNEENVDFYGRMEGYLREHVEFLISRGYSPELAERSLASLRETLVNNLREAADNPASSVLAERLDDPASERTLATPTEAEARTEPEYEADLNWLMGRITERATLEGRSPMDVYQGYGGYINNLWGTHQEQLARLGITSKNQLRKSISQAVKQIGA